ncbi:hypothetical protein SEVIR_5G441500v4 [Setaria viridis]|uniref:Uncharacterized protein n=1 Tax=Setaria viridis TaxID=4556 RepID=A0A4V6D7J4_SETVI|nr:uncharacterized protein LOC117858093 [Setaria viridis]TKW18596.1 hypothetical protein SEVIR_5G441500v2 [Setaria viridis]
MGCGASTGEGAEPRRRRRGWARERALGNSEASTTGLLAQRQQGQEAESSPAAGRRRGSKVAPEPKEQGEEAAGRAALPSTPGSPSFRYYCQKTAFVDKIVADADASSDGSVRTRAATTRQASNRNEVTTTNAQESSQVPEPKTESKEGARWLRFRGLSMVTTTWHNLFSRHTSKASPSPAAESQPPPAAAAAVRSHL